VAGHEEHRERVVLVGDERRRRLLRRPALALPPGPLAPVSVDQPPFGRLEQPAVRLLGNSVSGPALGRGDQRLLDCVLRAVEVAEAAGERAEDLRRKLAQQVLDSGRDVQRSPPAVCR
jgi:hypothetical protein